MIIKLAGESSASGKTGRAGSFDGPLNYYLHDKKADTSERVGFVELVNLGEDNPHEAWREMQATVEAAPKLKEAYARQQARERGEDEEAAAKRSRGGRKPTEKPALVFSINWHQDDRPTPEHMRETAHEALRKLGFEDLQAVIVQHNDQQHPHLHLTVNLIDPNTGRQASLSNALNKICEFCFYYEIEQQKIRTPERYEKHMRILEQKKPREYERIKALNLLGHTPPIERAMRAQFNKHQHPKAHENWNRAQGNLSAKLAAKQLKERTAKEWRDYRENRDQFESKAKQQSATAWAKYKAERDAIYARFSPSLRHAYKLDDWHKLDARARRYLQAADPQRAKAMQQIAAEAERIKATHKQQWREFYKAERTAVGTIKNALKAARVTEAETLRGRLSAVFNYSRSKEARREALAVQQGKDWQQARGRAQRLKNGLVEPVKAARADALARLRENYTVEREQMRESHSAERAQRKEAMQTMREEHNRAWQQWRESYAIRPDRSQNNERKQGLERGRSITMKPPR